MLDFTTRGDIAIDLGTVNTVMVQDGQVVAQEPTIIGRDHRAAKNKEWIFGQEALSLLGCKPDHIEVRWPMESGRIIDPSPVEKILRRMLLQVRSSEKWWAVREGKPRAVIAVPCALTQINMRAVQNLGIDLGYKTSLIYQPAAAALKEVDLKQVRFVKVVDIGGGTTDIQGLDKRGVIGGKGHSIPVAGNVMDEKIMHYVKETYNVTISLVRARQIKEAIGRVTAPDQFDDYVQLRCLNAQSEMVDITLSGAEMYEILREPMLQIIQEVERYLVNQAGVNPEFTTIFTGGHARESVGRIDPEQNLVLVTGGGSRTIGVGEFFRGNLGTNNLQLAKQPLEAAALGAWMTLENDELLKTYEVKVEEQTAMGQSLIYQRQPV